MCARLSLSPSLLFSSCSRCIFSPFLAFHFLSVSPNTFVHRSPEVYQAQQLSSSSSSSVVFFVVDLCVFLSLSLALATYCFAHTHTHTHRETRKKSRLAPRGYRLGRQYDVSSLVTIRRRQTDSHREEKRNIYWHSALFFLFSNSREIFFDRISFQTKKRGENREGGRWEMGEQPEEKTGEEQGE